MKNLLSIILLFACLNLVAQEALDTKIIVRTKAKDAKFIGTSVGGSHILIKNALD